MGAQGEHDRSGRKKATTADASAAKVKGKKGKVKEEEQEAKPTEEDSEDGDGRRNKRRGERGEFSRFLCVPSVQRSFFAVCSVTSGVHLAHLLSKGASGTEPGRRT